MKQPILSEDQHYYVYGGRKYVRITYAMSKIPRPWLDQWRANVGYEEADRIAAETADDGNLIHKMTELYDMGQVDAAKALVAAHDWLWPYFISWKLWSAERIKEWIWIERLVIHKKLMIGGRIDRMGVFIGDMFPSIIDIKSTTSLSDSMGIQLYSYRAMAIDTIMREKLPESMIPERTVIAHMPGPRWVKNEAGVIVDKTEFDKVVVKEYDWHKYTDKARECIDEFWALAT